MVCARRHGPWVLGLHLFLALLFMATLVLAASDPLVGRWRHPDGTIMDFAPGGILTIHSSPEAGETKMRYLVEEDNTLVLVREDDQAMTMSFKVSADGKRLTLYTMDDNNKSGADVLERIK